MISRVENWSTSLELFDELEKKYWYYRHFTWDRVGLSKNAVNAKLVKSETAAQNSVQHNAMSIKWKDKREVRTLTLCIPRGMTKVVQSGKNSDVARIIHAYNSKMSGVEKSDKIMTFYYLERKRLKNGRKPCGYNTETDLFSSLLHKLRGGDLTALNFPRTIIFEIDWLHDIDVKTFKSKSFAVNPFSMIDHHFIWNTSTITKKSNAKIQSSYVLSKIFVKNLAIIVMWHCAELSFKIHH